MHLDSKTDKKVANFKCFKFFHLGLAHRFYFLCSYLNIGTAIAFYLIALRLYNSLYIVIEDHFFQSMGLKE